MNTSILLIITFTLFACNSSPASHKIIQTKTDTIIKHDTIIANLNNRNWQEDFGLTHDPEKDSIWFKPVSYYLNDKNCSGLASDFYYGILRPSDDGTTDELLKLATSDNNKLRPFYRWCLNKTIIIQDGALGEHTGVPARKYAEKFPQEFFSYMDIDTSGEKYNEWIGTIEYSGFYDNEDWRKPSEIRQRMVNTMKKNCYDCNKKIIARIEKFAKDCFK